MSVEQYAKQKIDREINRRANVSIYSPGGQLRMETAQDLVANGGGTVAMGEYLSIGEIPYPADPYGSEHAVKLARLVEYIAQLPGNLGGVVGGPLDADDQKVLHAVAMLYTVGMNPDATQGGLLIARGAFQLQGYEARSATFAERFIRGIGASGTGWAKEKIRDDVCRLILRHNDKQAITEDKRLQVFSDAVRYETARLQPNTAEGLALLRERCSVDKFITGWAKDKANFRTWMQTRGWR